MALCSTTTRCRYVCVRLVLPCLLYYHIIILNFIVHLSSFTHQRPSHKYTHLFSLSSIQANVTVNWQWVRTNLPFILANQALIETAAGLFGLQLDLGGVFGLGAVNTTFVPPAGFNLTQFFAINNITDASTAGVGANANTNVTVTQLVGFYEVQQVCVLCIVLCVLCAVCCVLCAVWCVLCAHSSSLFLPLPSPQRTSPGSGFRVQATDTTIDPATGLATASELTLTVGNASLAVGNVTLPVAQAALLLPTGKE